jgi:hypothetical protein
MAAPGTTPVISAQTIMSILRHVIDPTDRRTIVWSAPVGRYIKGGRPAVRAFFGPLNRAFSGFKLGLKPGDLANVATISDVGAVIIEWFERNGYQVIL